MYNAANQRTKVTLADGGYWEYSYDALGQVIGARKYNSSGQLLPGMDYSYSFDGIGNRLSATVAGQTSLYSPNNLNQYTQRTVPGVIDFSGRVNPAAQVFSGNAVAQKVGGDFFLSVPVDNVSGAVYTNLTLRALLPGAGANGVDVVKDESGRRFLTGSPEAYTYDLDGNLLSDGRWVYNWDGENRLTTMTLSGLTPGSAPAAGSVAAKILAVDSGAVVRVEFTYDHQSRRIAKKTFTWNSSSDSLILNSENLYLYDGWNCIAEINGGNGLLRRGYLWGLDVSGSMQGAGGVGGQIAQTIHDALGQAIATYFPVYDGNGNVMALVGATAGDTVANYEYDTFGGVTRQTGAVASANSYRFSTKPQDTETGHLYYGYRFYNPQTGRWINRDPIEEQGGLNLYGFVGNDGMNGWDLLGMVAPSTYNTGPVNNVGNVTTNLYLIADWAPWHFTYHKINLNFPASEIRNIDRIIDDIYNDLKVFNHFNRPKRNRGGNVKIEGKTAYFRGPHWPPLTTAQLIGSTLLHPITGLTFWNVVKLEYYDGDKMVHGTAQKGHILEGTRTWKVKKKSACTLTIETSARERSINQLVENGRVIVDVIWGDIQSQIWEDYLSNIGQNWENKKNATIDYH